MVESSAQFLARQPVSLVVTGTDTAVGKTLVCGLLFEFLLSRGIKAGYQKWVSTGVAGVPEDLAFCLRMAGQEESSEQMDGQAPYRFALAASPHLAAEQEGREIDPARIMACHAARLVAHDILIVEGVGGVLVPLRRDLLFVDLVARGRLPALIVARTGLGTLNHTLLTLEALRTRRVPILGVVLSDAAEVEDEVIALDNRRTIAELGRVRVFGRLPRCQDPEAAKLAFVPVGQAILAALRATAGQSL